PLSLHDALPISWGGGGRHGAGKTPYGASRRPACPSGRKCRYGNELGRCEGVSMALAGTRLGTHYMWHRARDLRARCPLAPGGSAVMSRKDRKSTRLNSSHQIISYAV